MQNILVQFVMFVSASMSRIMNYVIAFYLQLYKRISSDVKSKISIISAAMRIGQKRSPNVI